MFDERQKHLLLIKRIAIIVLILAAIGATAAGVVLLLKNISHLTADTDTTTTQTGQNASPKAPDAEAVIDGYLTTNAIPALGGNYQVQQDASAPAHIMFQADDQTYIVSVSTTHYALFYAKDTKQADNSKAVKDQTTAYLASKGFAVTPLSVSGPTDTTYTTYANLGSACQLVSSAKSIPAYYTIACVDKTDIQKEYSSTKSLLDLYQKQHQLASFTQAISSTVTSQNKAMTTLSLTTKTNQHPVLLFAAVDNNWEYIGNIGEGSSASSNGKYSLSAEVDTTIHQDKYGDFLIHNLQ